jgi:hypothetical protein
MKLTSTIKVPGLAILMIAIAFLLFTNSYQHTLAQINNGNQTITPLIYKNPDLGLTMQYPSNWALQKDNLVRNTIAAFLLKEDRFHNALDFANITLAEVDLRVYPAPPGVTSSNLNLGQLDTRGQALITSYKNSTTRLGGLPAIKLTSYVFGGFTQKTMQFWTYIPDKHVLMAIVYIAQPPTFPLYVPAVQQMISSMKIERTSTSSSTSEGSTMSAPSAPGSEATQSPPAAAGSTMSAPSAPGSGGTAPNAHTTPTQNIPANANTPQVPTNPTSNAPQNPGQITGSPNIGSKLPSGPQNGLGGK